MTSFLVGRASTTWGLGDPPVEVFSGKETTALRPFLFVLKTRFYRDCKTKVEEGSKRVHILQMSRLSRQTVF